MSEVEIGVTVRDGDKVLEPASVVAAIRTRQGSNSWDGEFKQPLDVTEGKHYALETIDGRKGEIIVGDLVESGQSFRGLGPPPVEVT
ncbi:MAG TPA: hypothetical protein VKD90_18850 [Gemmataceae bacterium]|nr:hypothetical protein [Gemmataceae bacterium]